MEAIVIRTDCTREQLSTTAEDITIPNAVSGDKPDFVLLGVESADAIACKPSVSGDTTATAGLPLVIGPAGDPVVLDVAGCGILRIGALAGTPWVRVTALENG